MFKGQRAKKKEVIKAAESILPDTEVVRAGRQQGLTERRKLQEEQARRLDFKLELTPQGFMPRRTCCFSCTEALNNGKITSFKNYSISCLLKCYSCLC